MMNGDSILAALLEKILFDRRQLDVLKEAIDDVSTGKINSKELRERILRFRIQIKDKLCEFFPFYSKQMDVEDSFKLKFKPQIQSREDIKEKDQLLEEVSLRINNIYSKLKKKSET